jgi:hypothetical protein
MKICMIGDSHLASCKLGWAEISHKYNDVSLAWYGAPRKTLNEVRVRSGRLVALAEPARSSFVRTSGGADFIDPKDYDVFAIVGGGLKMRPAFELSNDYWPHTFGPRADSQYLVSEELFSTALAGTYRRSVAIKFVHKLRELGDHRIILCPQPMPSEGLKKPGWERFRHNGLGDRLARLVRNSIDSLRDEVSDILWQPDETIVQGVFTRREFSDGSIRLVSDRPHPAHDFSHMNAAFGAIAMGRLIDHLKASQSGRAVVAGLKRQAGAGE